MECFLNVHYRLDLFEKLFLSVDFERMSWNSMHNNDDLYLENTLEKTDSALGSLSAGKTGLFSFESADKLSPIQTNG